MTPSARIQAAIELLDEIIVAARDGAAAADTLLARYFKTRRYAGSKDRRAVRDLVYAAIRRAGDRPASGRAAMLGLVDDRPEMVELFNGAPHCPAVIAEDEPRSAASALPRWIMARLAALVSPDEHGALLERAPLDIRVNGLKASVDDVLAQLPEAQRITGLPDTLRLPEGYAVEQSSLWQQGMIEVQDAGSQMIAQACEAAPGMTVIDLCAGAGGKTLALAAAMGGGGRLIAADTNRTRLFRLPERADRAGAAHIELMLLDPSKEAQALAPLTGAADVVLVDAPCSGTGTWRRNPEARWRLTADRLARLMGEQARILDLAAPLVKPGGRLVYAVCALTDGEGRDQVEAFLARHSGWKPQELSVASGRAWGHGRLLTPAHDGTDGFFLAGLVKT
ncbi:MAG: RsmB/NOP family class I SAM-dependent RNA methyltransferase [Sphingobium sp.]